MNQRGCGITELRVGTPDITLGLSRGAPTNRRCCGGTELYVRRAVMDLSNGSVHRNGLSGDGVQA